MDWPDHRGVTTLSPAAIALKLNWVMAEISAKTQGYIHLHPLIVACSLQHPFKIQDKPELQELFVDMRKRIPVDGLLWDRVMAVASGPGYKSNYIARHSHDEHVILYYVEPTSAVVIDGLELLPEPGQFLYVAPGVKHLVKRSKCRRVVVAMLVS